MRRSHCSLRFVNTNVQKQSHRQLLIFRSEERNYRRNSVKNFSAIITQVWAENSRVRFLNLLPHRIQWESDLIQFDHSIVLVYIFFFLSGIVMKGEKSISVPMDSYSAIPSAFISTKRRFFHKKDPNKTYFNLKISKSFGAY